MNINYARFLGHDKNCDKKPLEDFEQRSGTVRFMITLVGV